MPKGGVAEVVAAGKWPRADTWGEGGEKPEAQLRQNRALLF